MATSTVTKKELQDMLDSVADSISEMLDPALTREQIVGKLQELDDMLNADDDESDGDDEGDEEE